ncbi:MAG: alpha-amylase family glycosyl hydrolase [Ferruginibacter sp.]
MKNYGVIIVALFLLAACSKTEKVIPKASIATLNCTALTVSLAPSVGVAYTASVSVPYSGGNGIAYSAGTSIASRGVAGFTATLQSGTLANGAGTFTYTISGTASSAGTAIFDISFGSISCSFNLPVNDVPLVQYGTPFAGVPDGSDAVIYQVNMRAFSATRNFIGVQNRLDSIKALGVNVLYLMPTYPVGVVNAINSPYCIKDYKGVNAEFGNLTDLRNLIDAAHSKGIAVLLDWVANHTSWDNPWITAHKEWYAQDAAGNILHPSLGWLDVAQLNFANISMRREMIQCMKYWVYTVNCDGFRCDYADGPPNDFWAQAIDTLRSIPGHKLLMLAESNATTKYAAGFNLIFGFNFYAALKSIYNSSSSVQTLDNSNTADYNNVSTNQQHVVRYLTNHDVNNSDGTALQMFGGASGTMPAFVVAATMKGVPMLYNGQEVGTTFSLPIFTLGNVINWNQNQAMVEEYKRIIAFRNGSAAVKRGTLTSWSSADICAFSKTSGTENIVVIANLRNSAINYTLPAAIANTNWTNAISGVTVALTNQVSLQPYAYLILKN